MGQDGWTPTHKVLLGLADQISRLFQAYDPPFRELRAWTHAQVEQLPTLGHIRAMARLGLRNPELVYERKKLPARVASGEDRSQLYAPWHFLYPPTQLEAGSAF